MLRRRDRDPAVHAWSVWSRLAHGAPPALCTCACTGWLSAPDTAPSHLTVPAPGPRPLPPLQGYVMLTHWLPEGEENKLPPNASHQVGVGAFVMNERREVLVVQERSGPLRGKGVWKMPTGLVQVGSGSVGGCICRPFQACCHAAQPCLCHPSTPLHPCTPSSPAPAARGGHQ